jgi:Raf kinase inhibitor-like YbhB/YbcL family protein
VKKVVASALVALSLAAGVACGGGGGGGMQLRSSAFDDGGKLPEVLSCEGRNQSPPLSWSKVPNDAAELALVVADPDAPGGVFHHWVVTGIRPGADGFPAGGLPDGAVQALGSSENATWIGPCPPRGEQHEYVFTLYPLRTRLGLADGAPLRDALTAISGARLEGEEAELKGTFSR